jgi:hypothetical protein
LLGQTLFQPIQILQPLIDRPESQIEAVTHRAGRVLLSYSHNESPIVAGLGHRTGYRARQS